MFNKTIALAVLALAAGVATVPAAHAGQGKVMLGSTGFADRCIEQGGQVLDIANGRACELPTTLLECSFAGAYADCSWNGAQSKLEVIRVIGMLNQDSLAGGNQEEYAPGDVIVEIFELPSSH
jgi:hypothetical protein